MNPSTSLTRRDFIVTSGQAAAAVVAGTIAAPSILRGATLEGDPVRLGHIGIGTRGGDVLRTAASNPGCRVVAVCDVYQTHLRKGADMSNNPEVKSYADYHDLLSDPKVEAVVIATPDHWHEQMLLDALAAGKDVYCEKGWTTSVAAAKRMRDAVKKSGKVMQLGHQGRQLAAPDVARKMLLDGAIGEITLVNVGRFFNGPPERPPWRWYGGYGNFKRPDPQQVIKELDWERWLGPAPKIDFNERHFWHWRCYFAYGTGQAGDLLSHEMDCVQIGAPLRHPGQLRHPWPQCFLARRPRSPRHLAFVLRFRETELQCHVRGLHEFRTPTDTGVHRPQGTLDLQRDRPGRVVVRNLRRWPRLQPGPLPATKTGFLLHPGRRTPETRPPNRFPPVRPHPRKTPVQRGRSLHRGRHPADVV